MSASEERKVTRIKEIDEELKSIECKYGMNYVEFYNHVEGDMSLLLKKFDIEEIMDDLERLITLIDEKEKLLKRDIFSELDEGWVKVFPKRDNVKNK